MAGPPSPMAFPAPTARHRADDLRRRHLADPAVACIRDEKVAASIDSKATRIAEPGGKRRAAVSAESLGAISCDCRQDSIEGDAVNPVLSGAGAAEVEPSCAVRNDVTEVPQCSEYWPARH